MKPTADGRKATASEPNLPTRGTLTAGLSFGAASFLINVVVSLITSVFIARLYGVNVVGQFALAFAPVAAAWLLSTVREQPALQRKAAVLPPRHPRLTGLFFAVFAFSTGLTVVIAAITAVVTYFVFHGPIHHPDLFLPSMVSLAGYTLFTNTCLNFDSIFIAFRDGRGLFWLRLNQSLVYLIMIMVGSLISRSVWTLVITGVLLWFFPCIHRLIIIRKWLRFRVPLEDVRAGFQSLPEILAFGLRLTPAGLLWGACDQVGTWVLGAVSSVPAVGAYSRASMLSDRLLDARQRLSELLFPTLVERRVTGDQQGFDRALVDSLRYSTAFMLLFASAGGGAANGIMAVFGPGFTRASAALTFLLLVPVATTMVTVMSQALIANNRPAATSITAGIRVIATVPLVWLLTKSMGITGTAIGMAAGAAIQLVCQLVVAQRDTVRLFAMLWPRRQMAGQLIAYLAGFGAARLVTAELPGVSGVVPALIAGIAAYVAGIVLVGGLVPRDRIRIAMARQTTTTIVSRVLRRPGVAAISATSSNAPSPPA